MKKIIALLLAVLMLAALCACGSKEEAAAPAAAEAPAAAPAGDAPAAPPEGEASGEPTGEPPADVPASGSVENEAHGTASADEAGYKEYLHAWLDYERTVNSTMTDDMKAEFEACIDAGDFTTFPADMLFNGMLTSGAAMTYDEFVAAGGQY